jgi:gamma-glutamyltranspeptidase/glutathione hydrolase
MHLNPFSSEARPALRGHRGAVSAAHPLAVAAGTRLLTEGGSAVDALVAAQAVLAVVAPDACGLGGDGLALVREPGGRVTAVNGAGRAAAGADRAAGTGGLAVTVPGLVDGWGELHRRWGRLGMDRVLAPAIALAEEGARVDADLARARTAQEARLREGGAESWALLRLGPGERHVQPELAATLRAVAARGRAAFYEGALASAIARAVRAAGGALGEADLARPAAEVGEPLLLSFRGATVHVQPPASQGVLLLLGLHGFQAGGFGAAGGPLDHLGVELTQAAFALREDAAEGLALLPRLPSIDPERAQRRGGPRAYLHTAGVAASDADGLVASSLVSVFDDFGSAVFVPEGGFTLNNRAAGFTSGANAFRSGARPVHTLAPALVARGEEVVALSTPGADGQVQTLLQVLLSWLVEGRDLAEAVAAPRWRSEEGRLLVERGHPARDDLARRGHEVVDTARGDVRFGAVTAAGLFEGAPWALSDWRRTTWAGVA